MSRVPDERGAELRALFFESSQELLQALNEEALKLEKQPGDGETVRSIRRIVHTLKGDAAASGFQELSEVAHKLEDALAQETTAAHASLAEIAFRTADMFSEMLSAYRSQTKLPSTASLQKLIRELAGAPKSRSSRAGKNKTSRPAQAVWTEYEKLSMQRAAEQGKQLYHVRVQIDPACAMPIAARQLVLKALAEAGEVLGSRPDAASIEVAKQMQLLLASDKPAQILSAKCQIPTIVSQAQVDAIELPATKPAPPATSACAPASGSTAGCGTETTAAENASISSPVDENVSKAVSAHTENILRVDAERIDNLLNLVGELIIGKSMLQRTLNEFSRHHPKDSTRSRFADAMASQSRVLNDLQRSVMKVRMVPVEQLFRRFPRMVRDVAKQCGKDVELRLSGQDTDLDKGLLDGIAEPLTHLVRNAVSHGIESAEERVRGGKPAQGIVHLRAYHQGNHVMVEISDDGRGIDVQKVKERARKQGLWSEQESGAFDESNALHLIFRPGFSTADQITEVSGRGVGLDVVQSILQRLKGTVQVETHPGQGTTFRLCLPLTLAIIKALLFRVEQRLYAIPLNAVAEIARVQESDLHQVDNREVLQLRNRALPVVRLGNRTAEISEHPASDRRHGKIFVLVTNLGERKLGLLVNGLEGEEELVIKALDDRTVESDLVSGASILGDGRVVLILNLAAIVERFAKSRPGTGTGPAMGLLLSHSERAQAAQASAGGRL
ncbi:MAG: chemotaxis protein CheA [Terriglobales bacterium]|jgi:two-component system, chemotaxis family, sensor kinase CheA